MACYTGAAWTRVPWWWRHKVALGVTRGPCPRLCSRVSKMHAPTSQKKLSVIFSKSGRLVPLRIALGLCRDDGDFDLEFGGSQLGAHHRGARGSLARGHPRLPNAVHFRERGHVGEPDGRRQQPAFIGVRFFEQGVDRGQDLPRLDGDAGAGGNLSRQVYGLVVYHGLRHTRPGLNALDRHGGPLRLLVLQAYPAIRSNAIISKLAAIL